MPMRKMRAGHRGGRPVVERVPKIDTRWKSREAKFAPPLPDMTQDFPFQFEGTLFIARMEWEPNCGGFRRWFRCGRCQHRRAALYIFRGVLACRACLNLGYLSERQGRVNRMELKYSRYRQRHGLGAAEGDHVDDPLPPRRKWQHQRTYERHCEQAQQLYDAWVSEWLVSPEGQWFQRIAAMDAARGL